MWRAFWFRERRSRHLIWNTWAAPIQWAVPCHWLITFSSLQRENTLNNKTNCFFLLWSATWIGSFDIRLGVSQSNAGEVGKGFGKEGVGIMTFVAINLLSSPIPLKSTLGIVLAKYVKTKCWNKKLGQKHHNISRLQCDESTQLLRPPCEYAGTRTGQQASSMFLYGFYLSKCHFASDWLDNIEGVYVQVAGSTKVLSCVNWNLINHVFLCMFSVFFRKEGAMNVSNMTSNLQILQIYFFSYPCLYLQLLRYKSKQKTCVSKRTVSSLCCCKYI